MYTFKSGDIVLCNGDESETIYRNLIDWDFGTEDGTKVRLFRPRMNKTPLIINSCDSNYCTVYIVDPKTKKKIGLQRSFTVYTKDCVLYTEPKTEKKEKMTPKFDKTNFIQKNIEVLRFGGEILAGEATLALVTEGLSFANDHTVDNEAFQTFIKTPFGQLFIANIIAALLKKKSFPHSAELAQGCLNKAAIDLTSSFNIEELVKRIFSEIK